MPTPVYYLFIIHPHGFRIDEFRPMTLPEAVISAEGLVSKMEGYQTVYRRIRLTGGLYSSSFSSERYGGPVTVQIVDASLLRYPDARDVANQEG